MCLSVVAKVIKINNSDAVVELGNVSKEIELGLLEGEVAIGDWVLLHTGFAIAKINEKKARQILNAYQHSESDVMKVEE